MAWDYRKDVVAPVKAAEESIIECDERGEAETGRDNVLQFQLYGMYWIHDATVFIPTKMKPTAPAYHKVCCSKTW
jgi:hypothetical protein